jgi:hypothetical protein
MFYEIYKLDTYNDKFNLEKISSQQKTFKDYKEIYDYTYFYIDDDWPPKIAEISKPDITKLTQIYDLDTEDIMKQLIIMIE